MIDVDSFIGEVHGEQKQGASYGYTRQLGYHPIAAVRADTGEVLHIRNRKGKANTQRGAGRFVDELLARVRRAGHAGTIVIRADSGFENYKQFTTLDRQGIEFSIGVKQSKTIKALIAQIPDTDWVQVADYPDTGEAQIAETRLGTWRLIVRRTRLIGAQAELFPDWRHHAFATNRTVPMLVADIDHRDHATIELVIRDLKDEALAHFPSGRYAANSAWTVIAALAHNLGRWATQIGLPDRPVQTARSRRRHLLQIPARLTRTSRQWTLRMPARWPWQNDFTTVLDAIRALPALTCPAPRAQRTPTDPPPDPGTAHRCLKTRPKRSHRNTNTPVTTNTTTSPSETRPQPTEQTKSTSPTQPIGRSGRRRAHPGAPHTTGRADPHPAVRLASRKRR